VADDIEVRLRLGRTDADIVQDATSSLELSSMIPETVQAVVHDGHVALTGKVEWLYQKESAERAVRHIRGVRGVTNHITVAPSAVVRDVRHRIVKALHQNADLDARHITVTV
jgi:osmotically-inducible protein OsmY